MGLKEKILVFLYEQVQEKKIPQIKPNMVEDFEKFIVSLLAEQEAYESAHRMKAKSEGKESNEEAAS